MSARGAYRLIVTRGGPAPAIFASPERIDHIEIVEVQSGEVVLFWDCAPRVASKLARSLHKDLAHFDAEEFIAHWSEHSE